MLYLLEMSSNISLASASFMFKAHVNLHFDQGLDLHFYQEGPYNYLANEVILYYICFITPKNQFAKKTQLLHNTNYM